MKRNFSGFLTLDQLKSLKPSLNETEGKSIFKEALKFYSEKVETGKLAGEYDPVEKAAKYLINEFLPRHAPPVKYIGSGIARFAFASEDGHVCKFAVDKAGMRQNNDEIRTFRKYDNWPCFVKMYDFDTRNSFGLDVEACATVDGSENTAMRMLGRIGAFGWNLYSMLYRLVRVCRYLSLHDFDVDRVINSFEPDFHDDVSVLVRNIAEAKTP